VRRRAAVLEDGDPGRGERLRGQHVGNDQQEAEKAAAADIGARDKGGERQPEDDGEDGRAQGDAQGVPERRPEYIDAHGRVEDAFQVGKRHVAGLGAGAHGVHAGEAQRARHDGGDRRQHEIAEHDGENRADRKARLRAQVGEQQPEAYAERRSCRRSRNCHEILLPAEARSRASARKPRAA